MPVLKVKTIESKETWRSPDGQRTIYELKLEWDGKPVTAHTFSDAIAQVGFEGEVETYERASTANRPAQTFVRQPKKEGGFAPINGSKPTYQPKDEKAIQAMWAIGQARSAFELIKKDDPDNRENYILAVENLAQELFLMVDRVKAVKEDTQKPAPDTTERTADINEIFDEAEEKAQDFEEEDPWKPKS